jgi:ligand-binding sensor domain-containing protein
MAVTQDRAGFIWVGTNHGLDRYDGYELKPYALPVNLLNGLSANRIRVLYADRAGQLWVGTERADTGTGCAARLRKQSWSAYSTRMRLADSPFSGFTGRAYGFSS